MKEVDLRDYCHEDFDWHLQWGFDENTDTISLSA